MDQGVAALLGALIGGLTTWLTTWAVELRRERRTGRSLAVAAASELDALLMMLQARGWRTDFENAMESAQRGVPYNVSIHAKDDYLPMCRAAMAHAGALDNDLAVLLARVITLADALIADIKRLAEHPMDTPGSLFDHGDPEIAEKVYLNLIQIVDAGFDVGSRAITLVQRMYPKRPENWKERILRAWSALTQSS